jgi:acetate kinase
MRAGDIRRALHILERAMTNAILVLNAGSSSLKFGLYETGALTLLCRGHIGGIGATLDFSADGPRGGEIADARPPEGDHDALVRWFLELLGERMPELTIKAAGHRVVHGGAEFERPIAITPDHVAALEALVPLAPEHQPFNLAGIKAVAHLWPDLPQVACFDTEFHRSQPRLAQIFPLPPEFAAEGLIRYGFHGLSYEFIASRLPEIVGAAADGRVIVAHLGHGASLCAMERRRSVATTMGFTALDGLMMGTRSGAIDPGVILHLIRQKGMTAEAVEDLLYNRSGLLGVSGISDDVRALEESAEPGAAEALDLFAYRAAREIGSLVAALGGLELLVFTAGIGEHSARVRRMICERAGFLGIALDEDANGRNAQRISGPSSRLPVLVVPTDEEIIIARRTGEILAADDGRPEG